MCIFSYVQAQMKLQDFDMTQRVDDLSHSVDALWSSQQSPGHRAMSHYTTEQCTLRMIRESRLESDSLEDINNSDAAASDSEEEDNQSFEDYCRTTLPLIGDRRASNLTSVMPAVEIVIGCVDEDPRQQCILSSSPYVVTQKSSSYPKTTENNNYCEEESSTKSEPLLATHQLQACRVTSVH